MKRRKRKTASGQSSKKSFFSSLLRTTFPPRQKKRKKTELVASELELLTDELIADTKNELNEEFTKLTQKFEVDTNPISPEEASTLITALLRIAASNRKLLNSRIQTSVTMGRLYNQYYGKVQTVSNLAIEAHIKRQQMEREMSEYRYHMQMLLKVRHNSYEKDYRPDDQGEMPSKLSSLFSDTDNVGGK